MASKKKTAQLYLDHHPRPVEVPEEVVAPAVAESVPAEAAPVPVHECTPTPITKLGSNGDEGRFKDKNGKLNYIGNYHKALPHNQFGEVDPAAYQTLLDALSSEAGFPKITLGGVRLLTNPQAGLAGDVEGPDPRSIDILAAPSIDSREAAAEAVELYWMALLRDVPFTRFGTDADVKAAATELSKMKDFTGPKIGGKVTPATIFRGCSPGDTVGPYLSQFLLRPIPYGSLVIRQRQQTVQPGIDYLTKFDEWLKIQNGEAPAGGDQLDPERRFIRNMRDLGQYVHVDALYEAYLNACLILLGAGEDKAPLDEGNPYRAGKPNAKTQIGFGTFGGPHILSLVTEVATRALKAVWWQKWFVHRRLRPEAYGGLVHLTKDGKRSYPLNKQVLDSDAVKRTKAKNGTWLLPMAFPEGSPTHPAYGAGHATVAGACVTILKAWFQEDVPFPYPAVVPNEDGTKLAGYTGPGAGSLTIGGELNKVAANIAIGRNMAGVHWRGDYTESVRLGERVALHILLRQSRNYYEKWSFTLTSFAGKKITVREGQVLDENGNNIPV